MIKQKYPEKKTVLCAAEKILGFAAEGIARDRKSGAAIIVACFLSLCYANRRLIAYATNCGCASLQAVKHDC
jgi:hypothetical protein